MLQGYSNLFLELFLALIHFAVFILKLINSLLKDFNFLLCPFLGHLQLFQSHLIFIGTVLCIIQLHNINIAP